MKKSKLIFLIELVLLGIGIIFLFVKGDSVHIDSMQFHTEQDGSIVSDNIYLKRGVYSLEFYYDASVDYINTVNISVDSETYNSLRTNPVLLYENLNESRYNFALTHSNGTVHIKANYGGTGELQVFGADLIPTNIPARIYIFWLVLFSTIIDLVLLGRERGYFTVSKKKRIVCLLAILILNCVPMMLNYVISGGDMGYHYMRIQALADALKDGQFPVRIFSNWLFGYGYADAVMYGHTLLYIPAILRLIGFSIAFSYKFFLVIVNALTILISYFSFKKAFGNTKGALLGTSLYCLMPYRLFAMYTAANVGIYSAGVFLPLVFMGMYKILTEDVTSENYKSNWIYVSIGLAAIIANHTLSTELTCGVIVLICIISIKRVFVKARFIELLKAAGGFVIASIWFIVPFLDNYLNYDFHVKNVSARQIQYRGVLPIQFFTVFTRLSYHDFYGEKGLQEATIMTNGLALTLGLFAFMAIGIVYMDYRKEEAFKRGRVIATLAVILAYMSTLYFPWDWIQNFGGIFRALVSSLQFPTRFIIYLGLMLAALTSIVYELLEKKETAYGKLYAVIVIILALLSVSSFSTENSYEYMPSKLYDTIEMGTGYTSGGEYLPQKIYGVDNIVLKYRDAIPGDNIVVTDYSQNTSVLRLSIENQSNRESFVDVPFLNYVGYQAIDVDTKEKFSISDGDNAEIRVHIPADYKGTIEVKYVGKWYWRAADIISLLFYLSVVVVYAKKKKAKASMLCGERI